MKYALAKLLYNALTASSLACIVLSSARWVSGGLALD